MPHAGAAHPDRGRCGVVEKIGPVGPATQKEVAPAQANTSRKRDAAEAAAQPAAALLVTTLLLPKAPVAAGSQLRQPHNRAAARRQQREARAGCQHQYDDTEQACGRGATVGHQSGVKIPVDEIVTEWREQSSRGRYEAVMWRAAGLEEPNAKGAKGAEGGADADAEMEVDSLTAGGFFGWMGREQHGAGRVTARAFPAPTTPTAAEGP